MASIDRTAYPRFRRVVSVRELAEAFTPVAGEVEWAQGRSQGESNFLALVVLLKCYAEALRGSRAARMRSRPKMNSSAGA